MKSKSEVLARYTSPEGSPGGEHELLTHLPVKDLIAVIYYLAEGKPFPPELPKKLEDWLDEQSSHWSPGVFLGRKYVNWGRMTDPNSPPEYSKEFGSLYVGSQGRANWERAIHQLAEECLERRREKSREVQELAIFLWEFLSEVYNGEGEGSPAAQFYKLLTEAGTLSSREIGLKKQEVRSKPDLRKHPLIKLRVELASNPDFTRLLRVLR